jgi:hypothetical protein
VSDFTELSPVPSPASPGQEARALRWAHMDRMATRPPVPPHVAVWRSVRARGETKTERSRRTLGLPAAAVQALRAWPTARLMSGLAARPAAPPLRAGKVRHSPTQASPSRTARSESCREAGQAERSLASGGM